MLWYYNNDPPTVPVLSTAAECTEGTAVRITLGHTPDLMR